MDASARHDVDDRRRRSRRLLAGLLLTVSAAGALIFYLASDYEILEKGQLLPYSEGKIYKVRFGGWLTLYVEPDLRPSLDLLNAHLLTGVAFIALTFAVILALGGESYGMRFWFFAAAFLGSSYLVADEALGLHETIGHNLQFLTGLPLVERPDDAVVMIMAVPAVLFVLAFRKVLLASRWAAVLFGLGLVGFLASAAADLLSLPGEEALEVAATSLLATGMIVLGVHHTRPGAVDHADQRPGASPAGATR